MGSDPVLDQSKAFAWTLNETFRRAAEGLGLALDTADMHLLTCIPEWDQDAGKWIWKAQLLKKTNGSVIFTAEDPVSAIRGLYHQVKGGSLG